MEEVAIRLLPDAEPAVAWESALAEGDDVRVLRDDESFGFATDSAAGSFADSSGRETLAAKYRCTDGDGMYPVWLGRSESGKLVSVVVGCGYLPELRIL
ncbi:DUF4241 domain-containing protein [Streptomyces griseorubiginosus]|uniref:DUF4241 domain-containing protein n=1 Tax=Streptomyces griseorubiginosus TaxID=67304 RepID=UPI002E80519D|nr:DUF4241 domain-containing protein [Streptomyces griseorubiginosus]WUB45815.1 DUF4241 domain-containing protein [Streptomyces griseorubiginosus]WUB54334.1 DUF4241 domain-containing protein [Streptomyces griseorubiginosus]